MEDFFDMLKDMNNFHDKLDNEYKRLKQDAPRMVKVGDKVLVAAGLIGRGHPWVRTQAEVIEIAQSSVKVRGKESYSLDPWEEWIDPSLITDVIY